MTETQQPNLTAWLWPDHVIGKRDSARLRDEHNKLLNSHIALIEALRDCMTDKGAHCYTAHAIPSERNKLFARRLDTINETVRQAVIAACGSGL